MPAPPAPVSISHTSRTYHQRITSVLMSLSILTSLRTLLIIVTFLSFVILYHLYSDVHVNKSIRTVSLVSPSDTARHSSSGIVGLRISQFPRPSTTHGNDGKAGFVYVQDRQYAKTTTEVNKAPIKPRNVDRNRLCSCNTTLKKFSSTAEDVTSSRTDNKTDCPPPARRLPDFLVIGPKRSGAKILFRFLSQHSHVRHTVSDGDSNFFSDEDTFNNGASWYRSKFPPSCPEDAVGDSSRDYFSSLIAPQRIHSMIPNTKIVIVLREPLARAASDYMRYVDRSKRKNRRTYAQSFEKAVLLPKAAGGGVDENSMFIKRGFYAPVVQRWIDSVGRSQILFVDTDRLSSEPAQVLQKVETFLGLEHKIEPHQFYFNLTRGVYCMRLPGSLEDKGGCVGKPKKHSSLEYVSRPTGKKVVDFYRPHNQQLFKVTGERFDWFT